MLILSEPDILRLLPMREAIRLVRAAFQSLSTGEAQNQPRRRLILPGGSVLHSMAGACGEYFGTKIYSTNPRHGAHFLFVLYAVEDGRPLALMAANHLGQIRTGAASGVATDLMARDDSNTLGIIGSGFQARTQLEAILQVRAIRQVRVWSRTAEHRERFARECSPAYGVPVHAAASAREAMEGADIVVSATSSKEPVVDSQWIAPGAHINAIGSNQAARRELPADLIRRAAWIAVDSMEQARLESGDLLLALGEADWRSERLVELKDIVAGRKTGRVHQDDVTIFKSNGLGLEDVAVAGFVYEKAREAGLGEELYS